jgi:hypothetical protein
MYVIGWTMVVLMVGAMVQNLTTPQKRATTLGKKSLLIAAIISVNTMSALDAASTIYLVAHDYSKEMNPVMNALMERSYLLFLGVKMSITIGATLVCWYYYERMQSAETILRLASRGYCVLMAWHCLLLSSVLL